MSVKGCPPGRWTAPDRALAVGRPSARASTRRNSQHSGPGAGGSALDNGVSRQKDPTPSIRCRSTTRRNGETYSMILRTLSAAVAAAACLTLAACGGGSDEVAASASTAATTTKAATTSATPPTTTAPTT